MIMIVHKAVGVADPVIAFGGATAKEEIPFITRPPALHPRLRECACASGRSGLIRSEGVDMLKGVQEGNPILVALEYSLPFITAGSDVIDSASIFYT
jgi:hypothetical protein